jgi:hypothetical protein
MLPGDVVVETVDAAVDYDPSEAVDQNFIVGITERGSSDTPLRTFSFEQWRKAFGNAVAGSSMYQSARGLFAEGCKALVTIRQVGPAPVHASSTAKNAGAEGVVTLAAISYGAYGNSLTRQFIAGSVSGVRLVLKEAGKLLAESEDITTQEEIVEFANATKIVAASILAGAGLPAIDGAPVAFTGGTDDHLNATNTTLATAAGKLDVRLGPGVISFPGFTNDEARAILREHHLNFDRVGLADLADSASAGTLAGAIAEDRVEEGADGIAAFGPWLTTSDGFTAPASALVGAKIAQQFLASGNPNEPAAGDSGQADFFTGLTQDFSPASREQLAEGGVNVIHDVTGLGDIQVYGFDTVADPTTFPLGTALSNALLDMLIRWRARKQARSLNFKEVDPKGHLASKYHILLNSDLEELASDGAIWAFSIDTESVNNAQTASEGKLKARIGVERSPYTKTVYLDVTNYAIGVNLG